MRIGIVRHTVGGMFALLLFTGAIAPIWAEGLMISEFMAANGVTLADEDGEFPDWIEVYNESDSTVNLSGWALTDSTDDLAKWRFPEMDLGPGQFLVVFASGKDRRDPGTPLHTNFKLSRTGEFLGLVGPGITLASIFVPQYPEQPTDASYGFPMRREALGVLSPGASARVLVPLKSSALPVDWFELDFDDSVSWMDVTTGIGYDRKEVPTFGDLIQTDVGDLMQGNNSSIFMRIPFSLPSAETAPLLLLRVKYESGFAAFINGVEVAQRNVGSMRYNSRATEDRDPALATVFEDIFLSVPEGTLKTEGNVLAVQAMNNTRSSTDFLILPVLEVVEVTEVLGEAPKYFVAPTPGWPNGTEGREGVARKPSISPSTTAFSGPMSVEMTADSPNPVIRYTVDGSLPDETSSVYSGPIDITDITRVRARNFESGLVPSDPVEEAYLAVDEGTLEFSSDIPLVVLTTFGRNIGQNTFTPMHMQVIDTAENGRSSITGARDTVGNGGMKTRGSSTEGRAKRSYTFEIQDDRGEDLDVEILGLPADSDWVLYGAYNFDRALLRNPFIYEVSNQVGRYATHNRFCELFVNKGGGQISQTDYVGVYSFMEKIKRGPHRVDVEALLPSHDSEPLITGGYMLKIDRADPGDSGFSGGGQQIKYVYPKEREITSPQAAWIKGYLDAFGLALRGSKFTDPDEGYAKFIDVDSWIDHHILNEFTKNPDEFWLSNYFFKKRGGKIEMGPIWDFDRALGPDDDGRAANPVGWATVRFFGWWGRLFQDPNFVRSYGLRWRELRGGAMSTENMHAILDSMADEVREAQERNFQKWPLQLDGGWEGEVDQLKKWVADRGEWMDSQLIVGPDFSQAGGRVSRGFELTILPGDGETYYTLNGPDPMTEDKTPAPEAVLYTGPITINENTRIRARSRVAERVWSNMIDAIFVTDAMPLVLTEIMFNPLPPPTGSTFVSSHFEFLEFLNAGEETLDLTGLQYHASDRLRFDFAEGSVTSLEPGEYVVIVNNLAAFGIRYNTRGMNVAGEFSGFLSNRSQEIEVLGPLGEPVVKLTYEDTWYKTSTDGGGHSLVLVDPGVPPEAWSTAEAWRPSFQILGSPGREDTEGPVEGLQLPGDLNQDNKVNIGDAVGILLRFIRGASNLPCDTQEGNQKLLDTNGDQKLDLTDAVHTLAYLFQDGPPPALGIQCVPIAGCPPACEAP